MQAKDVMTTGVITVSEDTAVEEVARLLLARHISAVPVVDADERIVGIVSEGDLVRRPETDDSARASWWLEPLADDGERVLSYARARGRLAEDVMSTSVVTAAEDDSLAEIARTLEKHRIKRVPVVRDGRPVGIVSRANLLHGLAAAHGSGSEPPAPPAGSPPVRTDDRSMRAAILNAIHNDVRVPGPINVIVADGVVDLWGGVETEAERQAVRAVAEAVPSVRSVNDHLAVMPPALRRLLRRGESDRSVPQD